MKKYAFMPADILLPKTGFEKWATIACDQFTSDETYWKNTETFVGDFPSALKLILPEIYLDDEPKKRIESINKTMRQYLDGGVFEKYCNSMIYVERNTSDGVRKGIVGLINLNDYDYRKGSKTLIRATEETVLERIPPRVKIRKDAPLELPHVMLLIDDPEFQVIEPLNTRKKVLKKIYDFELMQNGGHISGYLLSQKDCDQVGEALDMIAPPSDDRFMFAVGDGNHSLATAKECAKLTDCPEAHYALVEIVNIHDPSLHFEPIYRVVFNVDPKILIDDFNKNFVPDPNGQHFTIVTKNGIREVSVKASAKLPVGTLQPYLDRYLKNNPEAKIDYIHGEEEVKRLCSAENTVGFIFDGMKKSELFDAIKTDGSLPRKTFSMGHAADKRYYIEARKIK